MYTEDGSTSSNIMVGDYFHYTGLSGLIGILESKEIWLTDIRFLNDEMEFHYFIDVLFECFNEKAKLLDHETRLECEGAIHTIGALQGIVSVYVASFSKDGDSLPQWRGYSAGGGYNIGFSASDFSSIVIDSDVKLQKVNYCKADAKKAAGSIIDKWIANYRMGDERFGDFSLEIFSMASIFKDPSFESEQEWRLVKYSETFNPELLFLREGNGTPVPYIKVSLVNSKSGKFAAKSINTGPGMNIDINSLALEIYIKRYREFDFEIGSSKIPFRIV